MNILQIPQNQLVANDLDDQIFIFLEEVMFEQLKTGLISQSFLWFVFQQLFDEIFDCWIYILFIVVDGSSFHLLNVLRGSAVVRVSSYQEFIEEQSEAIEIQRFVIALFSNDFRGEVLVTTTKLLQLLILANLTGKTKVTNLHVSVLINEYVFRLQVSINEPSFMQRDKAEGNLYPNGIFLMVIQLLIFIELLVVLNDAVEIAKDAVFDHEVDIPSILKLVIQFDFIFGRILQNGILIGDHLEVALSPALGLVDPFEAQQYPIVPPLNEKEFSIGALADLLDYCEERHVDVILIAGDFCLGIWKDDLEGQGHLEQSQHFVVLLLVYGVYVIEYVVVFSHQDVEVEVSRVHTDQIYGAQFVVDFTIFYQKFQDFEAIDSSQLRDIDQKMIFEILIILEIRIDQTYKHPPRFKLNIIIKKYLQFHHFYQQQNRQKYLVGFMDPKYLGWDDELKYLIF